MKNKIGIIARRFLAVLLAIIMILLTVVVAVGIPLANNYANMVSMFMGQTTFTAEGGANPQYFTSDYESAEEVDKAATELQNHLHHWNQHYFRHYHSYWRFCY